MKSSDKFDLLTKEINKLSISEMHSFVWFLIGGTSVVLDKKSINKKDVLMPYEYALKHIGRKISYEE
jgi:hypothetical protein